LISDFIGWTLTHSGWRRWGFVDTFSRCGYLFLVILFVQLFRNLKTICQEFGEKYENQLKRFFRSICNRNIRQFTKFRELSNHFQVQIITKA
jgi:hypothetical protein